MKTFFIRYKDHKLLHLILVWRQTWQYPQFWIEVKRKIFNISYITYSRLQWNSSFTWMKQIVLSSLLDDSFNFFCTPSQITHFSLFTTSYHKERPFTSVIILVNVKRFPMPLLQLLPRKNNSQITYIWDLLHNNP